MSKPIFNLALLSALIIPAAALAQGSATYTGLDSTTQGTWTGHYGADGQIIPTAVNAPPSYANVTVTGNSNWVWANSTSDVRALQLANGSSSRIASMYYANSSFTIDVNVTDGNTHKVSLYLNDFDSSGRSQTISLVDAASQAVLSTESFSSQNTPALINGIYAAWSITGHVLIKVSAQSVWSAITNGIFFDTPGTAPVTGTASATFTGSDTTTEGSWTGKYGADGQLIPADRTAAPAYATVGLTGNSTWIWANSTNDARALQTASGSSSRIASMSYSNTSFMIDVNSADGNTHKISLYLCDFDSSGRSQTISFLDAVSQTVLSSQSFASQSNPALVSGVYASWTFKGHVQIKVTADSVWSAGVNGIFFDAPGVATTPAPTVTLTASPASIVSGSGSTLTWSSTNATACTATGGWNGTQTTSGTTSVSPTTTTTYNLACTGAGGTGSASSVVTVTTAVTAEPTWIYVNGKYNWPGDYSFNATPNYTSTDVTPLTPPAEIQIVNTQYGGWQPYAPGSGLDTTPYASITFALQPTVANQTWKFFFQTASGPLTSVNVANYGPAPVVGQWGVYTIPLSALGASAKTISTFIIQDITGLTNDTWYIDNVGLLPSGVPSNSVPPTLTFTANPTTIAPGGNSTLSWSSTNATTCTASGSWSGSMALSGMLTVTPVATSGYTLSCSNPYGSATVSVGIAVSKPGSFSVQVSGNRFVDGSGNVIQLRGVNLSAMEFVAIQGYDPQDPTGNQYGEPLHPNWAAINSWKANVVRIPLNEASWLGLTCTDTGGVVHNADPGGNYKQTLANLVQGANTAGLYVVLDLHWAAPGTSCPMLQTQMADADHSLDFWTSIANTYKNNPSVMFDLFNEPFFDLDFTGDDWQYLMFGTGGSFSGYPATGNSGVYKNILTPWNIASYQAMINAVRATGATNVVLLGALSYTADLSGWLAHKPNDPLNQLAASWHPYPAYGTTFGTPAYAQPGFAPEIFTEVQQIQAAGIPVFATETGDQDSPGTVGAPLVMNITMFADANGVSVMGWTWSLFSNANDVLIKDVNGTPTDGYGEFFKAWMVNHP